HEVVATILFPVFEYAGRCGVSSFYCDDAKWYGDLLILFVVAALLYPVIDSQRRWIWIGLAAVEIVAFQFWISTYSSAADILIYLLRGLTVIGGGSTAATMSILARKYFPVLSASRS